MDSDNAGKKRKEKRFKVKRLMKSFGSWQPGIYISRPRDPGSLTRWRTSASLEGTSKCGAAFLFKRRAVSEGQYSSQLLLKVVT